MSALLGRIIRLWGLVAVAVSAVVVLSYILPSGSIIAFQRAYLTTGEGYIFLLDLNTQNTSQLTDNRQFYHSPAWSTDGDDLVYLGEDRNIYQITGLGRLQTIHRYFEDMNASGLAWSPDGCCVAYAIQNERGDGYEIQILHIASERRWAVVESVVLSQTNPSWSPDGKTLAFMGYLINSGRPPRIYTVPVTTDNLTLTTPPRRVPSVVTDGFEGYAYPIWSPTGTHIYFSRVLDSHLMRVRVDGTIKTPEEFEMVDHIQTNGPVSFSPDGTQMIYSAADHATNTFNRSRLFIVGTNGEIPRQLTFEQRGVPVIDFNPVWRP